MAGRLGHEAGGILGLLDVLDDPERRGALEYDLLSVGLRLDWLGSDRLDWRDLLVVHEQAPSESALARRHREGWTDVALLLATVVDELRIANWLQTEDGAKGRNQPQPIPRPGVKSNEGRQVLGKSEGFETADDLARWYASRFNKN